MIRPEGEQGRKERGRERETGVGGGGGGGGGRRYVIDKHLCLA